MKETPTKRNTARKESRSRQTFIPPLPPVLQEKRQLPQILFDDVHSPRKLWPAITRQIINEDIHVEKDPNYLYFYEQFDIENSYHSSAVERRMQREREAAKHIQILQNKEDTVENKFGSLKLLEKYNPICSVCRPSRSTSSIITQSKKKKLKRGVKFHRTEE